MKHLLLCSLLWLVMSASLMARGDYDIYLLIGQSNMAGRGTMLSSDSIDEIPGVYLLNAQGVPEPAMAPLNRYSTIRKELGMQQVGLGCSFGDMMHRLTGRKVLLVQNARGGSSIDSWQVGGDAEGHYLDSALVRVLQARKYGKLCGVCWHQGETDVERGQSDGRYVTKFMAMVAELRQRLEMPSLPVVVGELGQWGWGDLQRITSFNDSTLGAICRQLPNCIKVSSNGLKRLYNDRESDPHFSREAQLQLGRRYADAMLPMVSSVFVTPYKGSRKAAVSFTFDDGYREHLTLVAPELEKRGFRATFWIIGNLVGRDSTEHGPRLTWDELRQLRSRGHELGSHTWGHLNLTRIKDGDSIASEFMRLDSAFEANRLPRPLTVAYPYNAYNQRVLRVAQAGRVATRTFQQGQGQQNSKMTAERLSKWLHSIVDASEWGVTMTHGILQGYDRWYEPQLLWQHFDEVKAMEDSVWVGTFAEVAAYRAERDATRLRRISHRRRSLMVNPVLGLDERIYDQPLTLQVDGNWEGCKVRARQGISWLHVVNEGHRLLIDFQPSGHKVHIHWQKQK